MDIGSLLNQAGGASAIARELGVDEATVERGAGALAPHVANGIETQGLPAEATDPAEGGLGGLGGMLGSLMGGGGGGILGSLAGGGVGNEILGQIFGSKDKSRDVAAQSVRTCSRSCCRSSPERWRCITCTSAGKAAGRRAVAAESSDRSSAGFSSLGPF